MKYWLLFPFMMISFCFKLTAHHIKFIKEAKKNLKMFRDLKSNYDKFMFKTIEYSLTRKALDKIGRECLVDTYKIDEILLKEVILLEEINIHFFKEEPHENNYKC